MSKFASFHGGKNDKLASAHLFTIVFRPPRLKMLILFMTFNVLWHFHHFRGTFMTYNQFMKSVKDTLEDKLISQKDWCKHFQGSYFNNFPCKCISICHAKTNVAQMQFKNQGATWINKRRQNLLHEVFFPGQDVKLLHWS